ncbi:mediator complex subunit Med8 [Schizosaccharomyces japonicus yFS275]|uniref:Mediator of RNA polymerase II transcription subunit 8 n=1 Tax=Schizosaccharomyces japonicus (strain yFS275 / FY16936) TaxID=402676 RepID=B6K4R0_SCHJY|nr:mediator complex subunit Med8 [Schizosaccharomyces japonicus yFS275]EEB08467.2 mediator complex subunit Med8 [Schizosaccharomyces japonicus yFS275]
MDYEHEDFTKPVESLESMRQKFAQIAHSLSHFLALLHQHRTLVPWSAIHKNFSILLSQLHSLTNTLISQSQTLKTINIFPSDLFPVREQEPLLTTLLRTKALPAVEEWENSTLQSVEGDITDEEVNQQVNASSQLWEEARTFLLTERENYNWVGTVTRKQENEGEFSDQKDLEQQRVAEEATADTSLMDLLRFMKSGRR